MTIPVYNDEKKAIARVKYNAKLDYWDGRNMTAGSTGRHLGYTRLKSGAWVLIHGTQWEGERDWAEVVTPVELVQAAARTGHLEELEERYPELKGLLEDEEEDHLEPETFEGEVTSFGNGAHVIIPKEYIGKKILYKIL